MKTKNQYEQIFLVLVPHRDIRFVLRKYSAELFKAGFSGAFQFPWVVPSAQLSCRLSANELKNCARAYREITGKEKISAKQGAVVDLSDNTILFGPRLENAIPQDIFNESAAVKIKKLISPSVIGSCLLFEQTPPLSQSAFSVEKALSTENVSFRAAAFANMYLRQLKINPQGADGAFGFKWKIGKLFWLPAV